MDKRVTVRTVSENSSRTAHTQPVVDPPSPGRQRVNRKFGRGPNLGGICGFHTHRVQNLGPDLAAAGPLAPASGQGRDAAFPKFPNLLCHSLEPVDNQPHQPFNPQHSCHRRDGISRRCPAASRDAEGATALGSRWTLEAIAS